MTANIKKRLETALEVGHKIKQENLGKTPKCEARFQMTKDVSIGDENGIYSIAINQNGSRAAVGVGSGVLQIFDCQNWERIRKLRTSKLTSLPLLAVKFYPCTTRNALYTGGSDGVLHVWDLDTYAHDEGTNEFGNQITALDFNNTGRYLVSGGKDSSLRIYDSSTMNEFRMYHSTSHLDVDSVEDLSNVPGHSKKVFAVKFHPDDSNVFLSASWDNTVKVWDIRCASAVRTIYGPFVCGDALDVRDQRILTASWKNHNALELWDYGSGNIISCLPYPSVDHKGEYLYCARFYDDHLVCAGGSGTNDMKLINLQSKSVVATVSGNKHPVQAVDVLEKKRLLVCGTSGNLLRVAHL